MVRGLLSRFWNWMPPLGHWLRGRPRIQIELFCLALILLIGALEYEAGLAISLSPLYAAPIALAAWFMGPESAFALSLFSIVYWVLGEAAAGAIYYNWLAPLLNCGFRAVFY